MNHPSTSTINNYHPQHSCGKVMFYTCLSFCPQGGCLADTLPGQTPLGRHTPPLGRHPSPPRQTPPWTDTQPPWADTAPVGRQSPLGSKPPSPSDSHCSGRYASYWKAFLFLNNKGRLPLCEGIPRFLNVQANLSIKTHYSDFKLPQQDVTEKSIC